MSSVSGNLTPNEDLTFGQVDDTPVPSNLDALGKLGKTMLDQDHLTAAEKATLENAAQALLDSPQLPEPQREALNKWLEIIASKDTDWTTENTVKEDPTLVSKLQSHDPEALDEALGSLTGTRLTPNQKEALRVGIMKKNDQAGGDALLKSWDPKVVAEELKDILKDSGVLTPDEEASLDDPESSLNQTFEDASEEISTLNIMTGDAPPEEPLGSALKTSENAEEIYNAMADGLDTSGMSKEDVAALTSALKEAAGKIADANQKGSPLAGLASADPDVVKETLTGLVGSAGLSDTGKAALSSVISGMAAQVGTSNLIEHMSLTILSVPPKANPFMKPGIMALLAPMLSELSKIYGEMIRQNSQMKQSMMGLMLAMAKESYTFAIAAGKAKVKQLEIEVNQYIASAVFAGVMIGAAIGGAAVQKGVAGANKKAWMNDHIGPDQRDPNTNKPLPGATPKVGNEDYHGAKAKYDDAVTQHTNTKGSPDSFPDKTKSPYHEGIDPKTNKKYDSMRDATDSDYYKSSEYSHFSSNTLTPMNTMMGTLTSQLGSVGDNVIKAVFTAQKISPTMEEARMNAMKEFISQLSGIVSDTMRTFGDESSRADKDWQAFNQLFKDFGSTIRQSIYSG